MIWNGSIFLFLTLTPFPTENEQLFPFLGCLRESSFLYMGSGLRPKGRCHVWIPLSLYSAAYFFNSHERTGAASHVEERRIANLGDEDTLSHFHTVIWDVLDFISANHHLAVAPNILMFETSAPTQPPTLSSHFWFPDRHFIPGGRVCSGALQKILSHAEKSFCDANYPSSPFYRFL